MSMEDNVMYDLNIPYYRGRVFKIFVAVLLDLHIGTVDRLRLSSFNIVGH